MASPTLEKCDNCGSVIGTLEKPYIYQDHIVCAACYRKLQMSDVAPLEEVRNIETIQPVATRPLTEAELKAEAARAFTTSPTPQQNVSQQTHPAGLRHLCTNCGGLIGNMEKPRFYKRQRVCGGCYSELSPHGSVLYQIGRGIIIFIILCLIWWFISSAMHAGVWGH
ncbi:MAG TPA: hypothetical protein VMG59_09490 [Phycisphaerae bacterium]|nr:hypothetical protein [Phycisphaerae bacterium]